MAYHVGLNPPNLCSAKKQKQKHLPPPQKKTPAIQYRHSKMQSTLCTYDRTFKEVD